jgi:hypothetical protein
MSDPVNMHEIMLRRSALPTPIIDAMCEDINAVYGWPQPRNAAICVARVACPKEPPAAWIEAMAEAIACNRMAGGAEKSHARWMLFTEATRCSYRIDAVAAYRAQPLWVELWGD